MMERADRVAELLRDVDHLRHLVGTIAVIVNEDVAAQHLRERLIAEIPAWRIALLVGVPFVPATTVGLGADPGGAVARHIPHTGRGTASRVHTLRILAARHL